LLIILKGVSTGTFVLKQPARVFYVNFIELVSASSDLEFAVVLA